MGLRKLFHEGLSVGRDHLAATVNTLVLAYAGGALPILLIFTDQRVGFGEAINREPVRLPSSALPGEEHGHSH